MKQILLCLSSKEPDKVHSVVIEATEELQDPVMGHTYRVKVSNHVLYKLYIQSGNVCA